MILKKKKKKETTYALVSRTRMHFIRRFIINADAYDIKIERWRSRRVTYRSSVPFSSPPPLIIFTRKQERGEHANSYK